MPRNSALARLPLLLAVVVCGACEREQLSAPSPTAQSPAPAGPTLVAVQIEGRVIDADLEEPIPGARVTTVQVCYPVGSFAAQPHREKAWRQLWDTGTDTCPTVRS
jgi:hypothetical protein